MENNVNYQEMYDRFDAIEKKHQEIKKMLGETNILVDSLKADSVRILREKQGVSDEEFRESVDFWLKSKSSLIAEVWGEDYKNAPMSVMCSMPLSEFVSKYKEYKDKQNEIKVRDVVKGGSGIECIVTRIPSITSELMYVLYKDGSSSEVLTELYTKTGKHYDSIDEFMNS